MKFGKLNCESFEQSVKGERLVNVGDMAMAESMKRIMLNMGIKEKDIIEIKFEDLEKYDGEYVIMPINTFWTNDPGNKKFFSMSRKIIPVFISISLVDTNLSEDHILFLKSYEPIGCRDERTMQVLRAKGIDAFLYGCATTTIEKRKAGKNQNKIFFVDVPYGVIKYIPNDIKKDIVFIQQERKAEDLPAGMSEKQFMEYIIDRYRNEARLIVSSRFHGACLGIGLGIPVIVVNETYTYRFSWLKKLVPFYTRENFDQIDWNPDAIDFEEAKRRMISIAEKRISSTIEKYKDICEQSEFLEYSDWDTAGLIDYYDEAIEYIKENWGNNEEIRYGIWGVNNNAEAIYTFISMEYPKAKLEKIYDSYRVVEFHGICSEKPERIKADENIFIFVTTFVAGYVAEKLFSDVGFTKEKYFICKRRYISQEDIEK